MREESIDEGVFSTKSSFLDFGVQVAERAGPLPVSPQVPPSRPATGATLGCLGHWLLCRWHVAWLGLCTRTLTAAAAVALEKVPRPAERRTSGQPLPRVRQLRVVLYLHVLGCHSVRRVCTCVHGHRGLCVRLGDRVCRRSCAGTAACARCVCKCVRVVYVSVCV